MDYLFGKIISLDSLFVNNVGSDIFHVGDLINSNEGKTYPFVISAVISTNLRKSLILVVNSKSSQKIIYEPYNEILVLIYNLPACYIRPQSTRQLNAMAFPWRTGNGLLLCGYASSNFAPVSYFVHLT